MARPRPLIPDLGHATARAGRVVATPLAPVRGQIGRGVYEAIRGAVLECTFVPGMALSEQALSDELQVSRAPVREAFRQLVIEELLESVPQRGTFVARLSRARIVDAVFVREAIECQAAALASSAPLAQRRALRAIVREQAGASARRDYVAHLLADEEFHQHILVLAGHPNAWGPLRLARNGMNRIRHLAIPELGSNQTAIDQHREVVDAIVQGDAEQAREAMRRHIRAPLGYLDALYRRLPQYFNG
jgi:DNA-binding GntR family transcriptional regulator